MPKRVIRARSPQIRFPCGHMIWAEIRSGLRFRDYLKPSPQADRLSGRMRFTDQRS